MSNEFWKSAGKKAEAANGRGGVVVFEPQNLNQRGKVVVGDDNTVTGTVIEATGIEGVKPGETYTFELSDSAIKALDKGVPDSSETGASRVALLGVKFSGDDTLQARHAAVIGDSRMVILSNQVDMNVGVGENKEKVSAFDKIVSPATVFVKTPDGKTTAFQAHRATADQVAVLESALRSAGRGVVLPKGATDDARREARKSFPFSVAVEAYHAAGARLLDTRSANDTRKDEDVIHDNLEKLRQVTLKHPNVRFAFRAFLVDKDGKPSFDLQHILFHRAKFDKETGYSVATPDFVKLVEEADKIGGAVKVEAIPYTTVWASSTTDGTYDATAVVMARKQLGLAAGTDPSSEAYRAAMRRAPYGPGMVMATAVKNAETGDVRPGALLRAPERLDGGFPSPVYMVTPNYNGSRLPRPSMGPALHANLDAPKPPEPAEDESHEHAAPTADEEEEHAAPTADEEEEFEFDQSSEPLM